MPASDLPEHPSPASWLHKPITRHFSRHREAAALSSSRGRQPRHREAAALSSSRSRQPRHREAVRPWRSMALCLHGLPRCARN